MKNFVGISYNKLLELAVSATPTIVKNYITHLRARVGLLERENDSLKEDWEEAVNEAKMWKRRFLESEAKRKASERERRILEADLISANRSILEIENKVKDLEANYGIIKIKYRNRDKAINNITTKKDKPISQPDKADNKENKEIPKASRLSPLKKVKERLNTLA